MKKSKAYHLDIRANRKNPYALLRHSYREDGKNCRSRSDESLFTCQCHQLCCHNVQQQAVHELLMFQRIF